jgi:predicted nucleic acid-binding protein
MGYLVDTNVLSELRKGRRCDSRVGAWFASVDGDALYLSVLVVGEMQRGADRIRRRDQKAAAALDRWLGNITATYADRILPVDLAVARLWGSFGAPDPIPTVDGLLAATAIHHELVLVTRNVKDIARTGVEYVDPFEQGAG